MYHYMSVTFMETGCILTLDQWATTLSGFLSVFIALGVAMRWMIKKYFSTLKDEFISEAELLLSKITEEYLIELKPNHGSSMNDAVKLEIIPLLKSMREDQLAIKSQVDKLEGRFEQHVVEGD
jgi:hypothetical protein